MSYHLRRKKRRIKIITFIIFILTLFFYSQIIGFFGSFLRALAYPIWVTEYNITENTINPFGFLMPKKSLLVANEKMKEDLKEAEILLSDRKLLIQENRDLKDILGRTISNNMILGSVISKPNSSKYDTLIIDLGINSGIRKEDKVFTDGNILIGEIEDLYLNTALVRLYSSTKQQTRVSVGSNNISTIATGMGGGNFKAELPRDTQVEKGDIVFYPFTNTAMFGRVEEIISNPSDPTKTLLFKSSVNLYELRWIQVLKNE